jgi:hypothetical protein
MSFLIEIKKSYYLKISFTTPCILTATAPPRVLSSKTNNGFGIGVEVISRRSDPTAGAFRTPRLRSENGFYAEQISTVSVDDRNACSMSGTVEFSRLQSW